MTTTTRLPFFRYCFSSPSLSVYKKEKMNKSLILAIIFLIGIGWSNKKTITKQDEMNLKNLFGFKTKPTINSLKFSTFNWNLVEDAKYKKTWVNSEQTALVGIQFFDNHPTDIPAKLNDINTIRNHYRNMVVEHLEGGLIRCEISDLKGYEAIEMIVKQPNQPSGMTYNGSFIIPFKGYNFVVKMQAVEAGMTGMREALTMDEWMKENGTPKTDENGKMIGFAKDPYDDNYSKGRLMNYSEKEEFDKDFPDHPLTIVRTKMKEIKESISCLLDTSPSPRDLSTSRMPSSA